MKAQFKVSPTLLIEVEAPDQKGLFKELAKANEVFGEKQCGKCKKTNIMFVCRNVDGNDFFEYKCNDCGAKLSMGQSKQKPGELFPKRKIITKGEYAGKPDNKKGEYDFQSQGWTMFRGVNKDDED